MSDKHTESHSEHPPEATWLAGSPWQPAAMWGISFSIMIFLAVLGMTRLKKVPGTLQGAWEFAYEWLEGIVLQVMGPKGKDYFPLLLCYFLFIFFNNLLGLLPGLASSTAKLDTTVSLALVTFGATHILGMKKKGIFGYIGHFFHVLDYRKEQGLSKGVTFVLQFSLLPLIEIIGEMARPLSLAMRLFGNIVAKEIILMILAALVIQYGIESQGAEKLLAVMPLILRPGVLVLGVLVSLLQAVVFTALSMVYINGAVTVHDEGHGHGEAAHPAAH
jgi:F-type H+-transporting ATPase subunit a